MKVLVKEKRKNQGIHKEQDSVHIAVPVWLILIFSELYHQPEIVESSMLVIYIYTSIKIIT